MHLLVAVAIVLSNLYVAVGVSYGFGQKPVVSMIMPKHPTLHFECEIGCSFANLKNKFFAERQALEPVLSQNIIQSQITINNQLITIIIKSKYY